MRAIIFLLLLTIIGHRATAQNQLWRIFEEPGKGGVVSIMGVNEGFIPITIRLRADLTNMSSSVSLPTSLVVLPNSGPQLLAKFTPGKGSNYSYQYYPIADLGIADGKSPDSTYVYSLPFGKGVDWHWLPGTLAENKKGPNTCPYFFTIPGNSPVCAARAGIVAIFHDSMKRNNHPSPNYIIIFHDDGSYAWYQYLKQNSVVVKLGQRVAKGELLGYSSAEKRSLPLWFILLYPGESTAQEVPVRFEGVTDYGGFKAR